MKSNKAVYKRLQEMYKQSNRTDLELDVLKSLLDEGQDYIISHIKDILTHGCVSGSCSNLIYYKDTYDFFDKHYEDIMDMIDELNDEGIGVDLMKDGDIKNTGAWLAYEETIRKIADELQIEY